MIIDTDVLIWHLKGNEKACKAITARIPFDISVITYMEIVQGMRNKDEMRLLLKQLKRWSASIIHLDTDISARAMFYVEEMHLSHAVELADALIAATVVERGDTLLTGNNKHYRSIPGLKLEIFRP